MNDKENQNGKLSFNFARDFKINENNKFDLADQGKSFIGSSRNYKLIFVIDNKTSSVKRTYSDIRIFYKKVMLSL